MIENFNGRGHDPIPMSQVSGLTAALNQHTRPAPGPRKRNWRKIFTILVLFIVLVILNGVAQSFFIDQLHGSAYWGYQASWCIAALLGILGSW